MDIKKIIILFMMASLLGCATNRGFAKTDLSFREAYVNAHPALSQDIKKAILEGKVINGMTKDNVLTVWGKPSRTYPEISGESWFYDQSFFSFAPRKSASFTEEGLVYNSSVWWE